MLITVYVQPGAKKTETAGLHDGKLKIRLNAPPVDGGANKELINFISKSLNLKKSDVKIHSGEKSRIKTLEISREIDEKRLYDLLSQHKLP